MFVMIAVVVWKMSPGSGSPSGFLEHTWDLRFPTCSCPQTPQGLRAGFDQPNPSVELKVLTVSTGMPHDLRTKSDSPSHSGTERGHVASR